MKHEPTFLLVSAPPDRHSPVRNGFFHSFNHAHPAGRPMAPSFVRNRTHLLVRHQPGGGGWMMPPPKCRDQGLGGKPVGRPRWVSGEHVFGEPGFADRRNWVRGTPTATSRNYFQVAAWGLHQKNRHCALPFAQLFSKRLLLFLLPFFPPFIYFFVIFIPYFHSLFFFYPFPFTPSHAPSSLIYGSSFFSPLPPSFSVFVPLISWVPCGLTGFTSGIDRGWQSPGAGDRAGQ